MSFYRLMFWWTKTPLIIWCLPCISFISLKLIFVCLSVCFLIGMIDVRFLCNCLFVWSMMLKSRRADWNDAMLIVCHFQLWNVWDSIQFSYEFYFYMIHSVFWNVLVKLYWYCYDDVASIMSGHMKFYCDIICYFLSSIITFNHLCFLFFILIGQMMNLSNHWDLNTDLSSVNILFE